MKSRLRVSSACLRITGLLVFVVGIGCIAYGVWWLPRSLAEAQPVFDSPITTRWQQVAERYWVTLGGLLSLYAVGVFLVSRYLERKRFWAWVAALILFALQLGSWLLPLGVLGLWGLLTKGTLSEFFGEPRANIEDGAPTAI